MTGAGRSSFSLRGSPPRVTICLMRLDEVKPTWYTGVPTMHQAILLRAPGNPEIVKNHRLRFIRSSSSALPPYPPPLKRYMM